MSISLDPNDTIAAISSPPGPAARGIVRLSGPRAWAVALDGFRPDSEWPPPRYPEFRSGEMRVDGLRPPLPVMLALWPSPRTYTGQPLAEIHLVGSPPLMSQVLGHCLARGARHAEPGEFTLRAFLSGRLDLTRAEAVLGVIEAANPVQLDAALHQLAGGLSGPILALRDHLLDVVAHLEANLDFTEEPDVDPIARAALADDLEAAAGNLAALARQLDDRDRPEGHPRVVLVGPPNAGKSRLFNAMAGRDRAIVSPQAGTTRDYLTALCDCRGMTVELVDTAGIEEAGDEIGTQAQARRIEQADRADLLLDCWPANWGERPPTHNGGRPSIRVRTRIDEQERLTLGRPTRFGPDAMAVPSTPPDSPFVRGGDVGGPPVSFPPLAKGGFGGGPPAAAMQAIAALGPANPPGDSDAEIPTSAATGEGIDALRSAIARALLATQSEATAPTGTAARCRGSLLAAGSAVRSASDSLLVGGGDELVAFDLRLAAEELGKVVGAVVTDDILDRIFRRFCIGK